MMTFEKIEVFFKEFTIWNGQTSLYWYELMWQKITEKGLIKNETEQDRIESFFYACALVDFYRRFNIHAADEDWSIDEFDYWGYTTHSYADICTFLNIEQVVTEEDYPVEEINNMEAEEYNDLFSEPRPELSEIYAEHIRKPYREKLLATLKTEYHISNLFVLMANTITGGNPYSPFISSSYNDDEDVEEENEDAYPEEDLIAIVDLPSYVANSKQQQDAILNDMRLIRAYEWLGTVY